MRKWSGNCWKALGYSVLYVWRWKTFQIIFWSFCAARFWTKILGIGLNFSSAIHYRDFTEIKITVQLKKIVVKSVNVFRKSDWEMWLCNIYWSKIFTTWFVTWSTLWNFTMFPSNILCSGVTPRSIFIVIRITTIIMVFILIDQIINFVFVGFMRTIREPILACVTTFGDIYGSFVSWSIVSLNWDFQRKLSQSWILSSKLWKTSTWWDTIWPCCIQNLTRIAIWNVTIAPSYRWIGGIAPRTLRITVGITTKVMIGFLIEIVFFFGSSVQKFSNYFKSQL